MQRPVLLISALALTLSGCLKDGFLTKRGTRTGSGPGTVEVAGTEVRLCQCSIH